MNVIEISNFTVEKHKSFVIVVGKGNLDALNDNNFYKYLPEEN